MTFKVMHRLKHIALNIEPDLDVTGLFDLREG